MIRRGLCLAAALWAFGNGPATLAQDIGVREDGSVAVPALDVPPSPYLSDEGHRSRVEHILTERALEGQGIDAFNAALFGPRAERTRAAFVVRAMPDMIGGVPVVVYEPAAGIAADRQGRVIVNIHGGGFVGCFEECGALESIPVAAMTGMRVIAVDYRVFPQASFPAASVDVEAVYRELLNTVPASRIGIFGCSAGGVLTSQALARFHARGLPRPAAAAILCAGGDPEFAGDSMVTGMVLGDGALPRAPGGGTGGYFASASETDPTAYPTRDPATLAWFPPTLIGAGTRDFAFSSAVNLHRKLVAAGVDARLHAWDGGRHAFFYDIRVPEALEVFTVLSNFLVDHLR